MSVDATTTIAAFMRAIEDARTVAAASTLPGKLELLRDELRGGIGH